MEAFHPGFWAPDAALSGSGLRADAAAPQRSGLARVPAAAGRRPSDLALGMAVRGSERLRSGGPNYRPLLILIKS